MLILSRAKNESIYIGESVVSVLEFRGANVKLGIAAPRSVRVLRAEIIEPDQTKLIPPEDKTRNPVLIRLRRMSEVARQQTISAIIMEFCGPKKEMTCQS
jgi:carbon storage regulator